jgi:hypothetical protein
MKKYSSLSWIFILLCIYWRRRITFVAEAISGIVFPPARGSGDTSLRYSGSCRCGLSMEAGRRRERRRSHPSISAELPERPVEEQSIAASIYAARSDVAIDSKG